LKKLLNYKSAQKGTFKKMGKIFSKIRTPRYRSGTFFLALLKIRNYFEESWRELKKVNWPTQPETVKKTVGVLTLSLFIALILGFLDFGLLQIMKLIIK